MSKKPQLLGKSPGYCAYCSTPVAFEIEGKPFCYTCGVECTVK